MGDQGKPLRVFIQFAPAAEIRVLGLEEIDGALKFVGPVFLRGYFPVRCIDVDYGASRDHGVQSQIEFADDPYQARRAGRWILCLEQRGFVVDQKRLLSYLRVDRGTVVARSPELNR